jgi:hypothetical protein
MSQEAEIILRKSLDEVDKIRRRQIIGLVIFLLFFLLQAASVIGTLHKAGASADLQDAAANGRLRVTLIANTELMVYTVGFCTFGVCFFITRMTSKILKAIELSSKA